MSSRVVRFSKEKHRCLDKLELQIGNYFSISMSHILHGLYLNKNSYLLLVILI